MSRVAKLVVGLGALIFLGTLLLGFTIPVGSQWNACSGAFSPSHPGAEQIAASRPGTLGALAAVQDCQEGAEKARPGYFIAMGVGALVAFAGLLIAAKKPAFRPVASELASLAKLHENGTLTDAEFEDQKRRLLGDGHRKSSP